MKGKGQCFDYIILVFFSPFFFLILFFTAFVFYCYFGRDFIFRQERLGFRKRPFELYKFRTIPLVAIVEDDNWNFEDPFSKKKYRIPKMVLFLRNVGFDEWPQLINILKGELSFVGPRPLPIIYKDKIVGGWNKRFHVNPGLTGSTQLDNSIESWAAYFASDIKMVESKGVVFDLKILFKTMLVLLFRKPRLVMKSRLKDI